MLDYFFFFPDVGAELGPFSLHLQLPGGHIKSVRMTLSRAERILQQVLPFPCM